MNRHVTQITAEALTLSEQQAKERRAKLAKWFKLNRSLIVAVLVAGVVVFGQMHQRDKVDATAVSEGRIPAITLKNK